MAMETKQKEKKKENRFSFLYILGGGILKEDFIVRHTKMIVLVVVLIFIFIGNRYVCMQRLREIDRLQLIARCAVRGAVHFFGIDRQQPSVAD